MSEPGFVGVSPDPNPNSVYALPGKAALVPPNLIVTGVPGSADAVELRPFDGAASVSLDEFEIDWGDGSTDTVAAGAPLRRQHVYTEDGKFNVRVTVSRGAIETGDRVIVDVPFSPDPDHAPVPVLTSIAPTTGEAPNPAFTLTVTGTGFVSRSRIRFGTVVEPATVYVNPTTLTVAITGGLFTQPDNIPVSVVTAAPGGGESAPQTYVLTAPPEGEDE